MNNLEQIRLIVLGNILSANSYGMIDLNVVMASGVSKELFIDPAQISMFEVMKLLYDGDIAFDDSTLVSYMQKAGVTHPQQLILAVMAEKEISQSILLEHIALLKEDFHKKMLFSLSDEIRTMFKDESVSADVVQQMIQNAIDKQVSLNNSSSTKRLSDVRTLRKAQPPVQRVRTYIPFIDTVLTDKHGNKGIRNEGLFFISGLKQSGKTFVLTRLIENVSRKHPVMFGSMEFGQDLYDENVEQQEEDGNFDGNIENIYTFDDVYEINAIMAEIRLQHKLHGIKLVALDSMMRMTNNNPELKTDERRISETFSKLGKLSKELKIPIIVVVQSSKEDLKSSMISVKGSMNADHEAYVWFHLTKSKPKDAEDEMRNVIWNKNKDTHKHPTQTLMFVPQTSDFYRVEVDEHGNAAKALDKFRKPPAKVVETVYEEIPAIPQEAEHFEMPDFM